MLLVNNEALQAVKCVADNEGISDSTTAMLVGFCEVVFVYLSTQGLRSTSLMILSTNFFRGRSNS